MKKPCLPLTPALCLCLKVSIVSCMLNSYSSAEDDSLELPRTLPVTVVQSGEEPEPEEPPLRIYDSPELSMVDLVIELDSLSEESRVEIELLETNAREIGIRLSKYSELHRKGLASQLQLDRISMELLNARELIDAEKEYLSLVDSMRGRITSSTFQYRDGAGQQSPEFHVRIPGLSIRVGDNDYFTARMKAGSGITEYLQKYSRAKVQQHMALPQRRVFRNYFEKADQALRGIPSVMNSELQRSSMQLVKIEKSTELANHRYSRQLRETRRIADFHKDVVKCENDSEAHAPVYGGSDYGFWLLGDGKGVAQSSTSVSGVSLAVAYRKAQSTHEEIIARILWEQAMRHHQRISGLIEKGCSGKPELKKAKRDLDVAQIELDKRRALRRVAQLEYEQLAIAHFSKAGGNIDLPKSQNAAGWLAWYQEQPTADCPEVIRFLRLAEECFTAAAEKRGGDREVGFHGKTHSLYRKIRSVREVELEKTRLNLARSSCGQVEASEEEQVALLKLVQWTQRVTGTQEQRENVSPEAMEAIINHGREVTKAKIQVAELEYAKQKALHMFDYDYLMGLMELHRKGVATDYEFRLAHNQAKRSRGAGLSAYREFEILRNEGDFNEILFENDCVKYDEKQGLTIVRFPGQAIEELESLTILKEGIDEGRILELQADKSDLDLQLMELSRLIDRGHASLVEAERVAMQQKRVENLIALENARDIPLEKAVKLVSSLEFNPLNIQNQAMPVALSQ
ncbi:MAG: hypothetical protein P1V20_11105 [Verrucomicrobiales bacterium]|nr:hypothetical protein [Verrucomicrobiales bacterium]